MSYWVAGSAAVMATSSLVSGVLGSKAAAKEADRRRKAEMDAAEAKYSAIESSVNLMKAAGREAAYNASLEVLRAEGVQERELKGDIRETTSTLQSKSEGLTSGRSKGRQMLEVKIKGSQAIERSEQQGADMISQITKAQDKQSNDLNNQLLSAHQELTSVLSTPGEIYHQDVAGLVGNTINAGIKGAMIGSSLAKAMAGASTPATTTAAATGARTS
jgi:hypothetical protein